MRSESSAKTLVCCSMFAILGSARFYWIEYTGQFSESGLTLTFLKTPLKLSRFCILDFPESLLGFAWD